MAITTLDGLFSALKAGAFSYASKQSVSGAAQTYASLFRQSNVPAAGSIPTTAEVCHSGTVGAMPIPSRSSGQNRVLGHADHVLSIANNVTIVEDRLAQMGGLSGTVTTAQTVNVDVSGSSYNLPERIGNSDFSEVRWWLDIYAQLGATVVTPTASVTFADNSTGTVNIQNAGATTLPANAGVGRRFELVPTNGKKIKSVQSVTLSATTGTAGNFGVSATREIAVIPQSTTANKRDIFDWAQLAASEVFDDTCMVLAVYLITTSTGSLDLRLKFAVG